MGREYTEAQKRATLNYQKSKARIQVWLTPEDKNKYEAYAQSKNLTLTQLITQLLDEKIESGK